MGFYNRIQCCFYISFIALILTSILTLLLIHISTAFWLILTMCGTEWPILCWCAVKKLLTHDPPPIVTLLCVSDRTWHGSILIQCNNIAHRIPQFIFEVVFVAHQPSQFCLSVTWVDQSKTVQARFTKSSLWAAWKTLVSGTVKLIREFEKGHLKRGC